jgi:VWFA-related protein
MAILSLAAFAQKGNSAKGGSASQTVIRTETRLVLVDAIVRDKKGKIVTDLGPGDFRLWEDGKAKPIASFSRERAGSPDQPEAQHFVFLFDELGDSAASRELRQRIADFAGAYASPDRLMAVANFNEAQAGPSGLRTTTVEVSITQEFTAMADRVQQAAVGPVPAAGQRTGVPIVQSIMEAIRVLADSMANIRGRKSLIVVSASPLDWGPWRSRVTQAMWQEDAIRTCNRADVAVYAANPDLRTLADATGGRWIGNDLARELGAIVDDQEKGYVLGFQPFESPDGRCHSLRVQTTRRGLEVRARNAYCNVKAPDQLAENVNGKELEALAAGLSAGNAAASMELPYFYSSPGIALVDLAMEMDLANLKFVTRDGKQHADLDLVGLAYATDGQVAGRFSETVPLDFATPEEADAFRAQPYHYERQFRLPTGRYNVRVAFGSGDLNFGKAEAPLTIDAWDGRHLAISGIALSSGARKVADLTSDLDPSMLEGHKDLIAASLEISPSGSNRFRGAAPCVGYLEINEPLLAGPNPPAINLEIRVLDRQTGEQKEARTLGTADFVRPGNPVVPVLLRAPIASLPQGSYVLEVKALRSPGEDTVVRTVEFAVSEEAAKAAADNEIAEAVSQPEGAPPAPPPLVIPAAPGSKQASEAEQEQFLAAARQFALEYAKSLPNFLCTQTVIRFIQDGLGSPRPRDTLTVEVSYFDQQEDYRLTEVNGGPAGIGYSDARGTVSRGEFGNNLRTIFDPASAAEFHFERWTTLRGRRAAVYSFRVERSKAHYAISASMYDEVFQEQVGLRGEAAIDRETYGILRLIYMADAMPPGFPVQRTSVTVDYGDAEIAGKSYLLPLKAVVELQRSWRASRNEVTFHSYRKFSSDSSVSFGEEEPKPQP